MASAVKRGGIEGVCHMRKMYRVALCSSVASAALMLAASAALAQTVVTQTSTNNSQVSNPSTGTNTIDLGGGGLGAGASVSTSAGGAVVSTSVTGINSQFVNPTGGFGTVTQSSSNLPGGNVTNSGAITGASGDAASGSSLSVSARGAAASFSIIAVGGIPFVPVATVGDISQGSTPTVPAAPPVVNVGSISNTGEITGPSGGTAIDLSGMGASASVSATGAQSSVALSVMGATTFTGTTFGNINQAPSNNADINAIFGVQNILSSGGVSLGAISGAGAGVSVAATGSAASIAFSYIETTNWSPTTVNSIFQNPTNNTASVTNSPTGGSTVSVGAISGDGASVRIGATGAIAGISYSSIGSTAAAGGQAQTIGSIGQLVTNNGTIRNAGTLTGTGLTGAGSSAGINALGAGAAFSVSSIGDVSTAPLTSPTPNQGFSVFQQVTNTGLGVSNQGTIGLGTGALANGASASMSATGAQAAISVGAINTTAFTTPLLGVITQTTTNGGLTPTPVTNEAGITTGNLSGHGSSVSVTATGAASSIGISFINTPAWSSFPLGPVNQTATNNGAITNGVIGGGGAVTPAPISVGSLSGTGASVRASATGAAASIAVTSILSGPPATNTFGSPSIIQGAFNTGAVVNSASIVSTGTLSGMASSASINATGAATSVAVASIGDTVVIPPPTATITTINQTSTNNLASPITNTGSITLAGGNMGAGAAASISAVGASASISFLAIR